MALVAVTIENGEIDKIDCNEFDWRAVESEGNETSPQSDSDFQDLLNGGKFEPEGKANGKMHFKEYVARISYVSRLIEKIAASWKVGERRQKTTSSVAGGGLEP